MKHVLRYIYIIFHDQGIFQKVRQTCDFSEKGQKKGKKMLKKGKIFENFGQKCTKFESILKKGK